MDYFREMSYFDLSKNEITKKDLHLFTKNMFCIQSPGFFWKKMAYTALKQFE